MASRYALGPDHIIGVLDVESRNTLLTSWESNYTTEPQKADIDDHLTSASSLWCVVHVLPLCNFFKRPRDCGVRGCKYRSSGNPTEEITMTLKSPGAIQ